MQFRFMKREDKKEYFKQHIENSYPEIDQIYLEQMIDDYLDSNSLHNKSLADLDFDFAIMMQDLDLMNLDTLNHR